MELTRDWRRQATRAAGMTALGPAVLLGSAVILAAGAGFGGLGSLGQVADGPSVPAFEEGQPSGSRSARNAPAPAPVAALATPVGASEAGSGAGAASSGGGSGGRDFGSNGPAGSQQAPAGTSPGARTPATPTPSPNNQSAPQTGSTPTDSPTQTSPGTPQTQQSPQLPQLPTGPNPVQQILELPRAIGQSLPDPIGPLTDRVLQGVTGNSPR